MPAISALDTGPLDSGTQPLNLPIQVNLQFWGFFGQYNSMITTLQQELPKLIVHQSVSPDNSTPSQHKVVITNRLYGFQSTIRYTFSESPLDPNGGQTLITRLNNSNAIKDKVGTYLENNSSKIINGSVIDHNLLAEELSNFDRESGYTINILNFQFLDNPQENRSHWIEIGSSNTELDTISDMRNVGISGNKSIFYDPTAFAPRFESGKINFSSSVGIFLAPRLIKIIEQVIIGSPHSTNYLAMESRIHADFVLIGANIDDTTYQNARNLQLSSNEFEDAVTSLVPYFSASGIKKEILLNKSNDIADHLQRNEEIINGTPTIIVDSAFTERMKWLVRSNAYAEFPSGYYFSILVMADSSEREYIYESKEGYKTYEIGQIGLGILNLKRFGNLSQIESSHIQQLILKTFGKMLGITELSDRFTSQFESPMSSYGVSSNWDHMYTPFEIDRLARRYSALYNRTTLNKINDLREDLRDSFFKWIDQDSLDKAETKLIEANTQYYFENYTRAAAMYLEAFKLWEDAEHEISQTINAFYNSINFIGVIIILWLLINFLRSLTITKEELLNKISGKERKNDLDVKRKDKLYQKQLYKERR
ncbi:MAG: hypothetical protein ACXAD7_12190 [Candidatus Kariarchaeaceae archaeon]